MGQNIRQRKALAEFSSFPGGEIEIDWSRGNDQSEAHTLAMSIRELLEESIWDVKIEPYAHWITDEYRQDPLVPIQEILRRYGQPPAASHQFQRAYLSGSFHPEEHSDFRYYLERLATTRLLIFFYSGVVDAAHEPEDFALYASYLDKSLSELPAIYTSCDYHYGPETLRELLRDHEDGILKGLDKLAEKLGPLTGIARWLVPTNPEFWLGFLEKRIPEVFRLLEKYGLQFPAEQLSHATYAYLGDVAAFGRGRHSGTRSRPNLCQPWKGRIPQPAAGSIEQANSRIPSAHSP